MARIEGEGWARARRSGTPQRVSDRLPKIGLFNLVIVFSLLVGACADIRLRMGNRPNTDVLETSLRVKESTRADVLGALGEPSGKGRAMLPFDTKPKTTWSYYYGEGSMKDSRQMLLFVYFDEDLYDGYMWFSSLPK